MTDAPSSLLALEGKARRMHSILLLIGTLCMADGLTHIPSNPASAFAFGLGLAIPGMIDATRSALRSLKGAVE